MICEYLMISRKRLKMLSKHFMNEQGKKVALQLKSQTQLPPPIHSTRDVSFPKMKFKKRISSSTCHVMKLKKWDLWDYLTDEPKKLKSGSFSPSFG